MRTRVLATLALLASVFVLTGNSGPAAAQTDESPTILFVVDTSGSMGGSRITQAREALHIGVDALAADQPAGLRSFAGSCGNGGILRTAIGVDNRDEMRSDIDNLSTGGGTPTPDALRAAADDLSGLTGPRAIVLISDGQSGCGDPCVVAAEIAEAEGIEFKVHAVGFRAPDAAEAELECIADATGGRYFSADDAEGLADAIGDVVGTDTDRDGDGLLNIWETNGYDADGDGTVDVDLPAMGADPDVADVFVEVDWMTNSRWCVFGQCASRESHQLTSTQIRRVTNAFADAPEAVRLHIDSGPDSALLNGGTWGDLAEGNRVHETRTLDLSSDDATWQDEFDSYQAEHFDPDREQIFHYALMGHDHEHGWSGISRGIPGRNFVVTLGDHGDRTDGEISNTFMHELGHNLSLGHGGDELGTNHKPNYLSVMNYLFQFPGIPAGDRFGATDYSDRDLPDLDETDLSEFVGIGGLTSWVCPGASTRNPVNNGGGAPADWDCNGLFAENVLADINGDGAFTVLSGWDDWANLGVGDAISGAGAIGHVDEVPADELPRNTDDRILITGNSDLVVDTGAPAPTLTYTVRNAGDDPDLVTIDVTGTAAAAMSETVLLGVGASRTVTVTPTGAGVVTVVATSGNNPNVASTAETVVTYMDFSTVADTTGLLEAVAAQLRHDATLPGTDHQADRDLYRASDDIDDAIEALAGNRPTWNAKQATLDLEKATTALPTSTGNSNVDEDVVVAARIINAVAQAIATDAVEYAETNGGNRTQIDNARGRIAAGADHRTNAAWRDAAREFKQAGSAAYSAYRT